MQKYQILGKSGEGTFSEVLKAQNKETKNLVAIKCFKKCFESKAEAYDLREIHAYLKIGPHENIVNLVEVLFDKNSGRLAIVFEHAEMNLYELIRDKKQFLPEEKILKYMYEFLKGLEHAHSRGLFHRDIKPENVLITSDDTVKLADFGSCRGRNAKQPFTEYISTRWYRAPECLITDGYYSSKMDVWGAGCVFFEMATLVPLFVGSSEIDQVNKIHSVLGSPPAELMEKLKAKGTHMSDVEFPTKQGTGLKKLAPNLSDEALDLLAKMLAYDEEERISAKEALRHPYFKTMRDEDRAKRRPAKKGGRGAFRPAATRASHNASGLPSIDGNAAAAPTNSANVATGTSNVPSVPSASSPTANHNPYRRGSLPRLAS